MQQHRLLSAIQPPIVPVAPRSTPPRRQRTLPSAALAPPRRRIWVSTSSAAAALANLTRKGAAVVVSNNENGGAKIQQYKDDGSSSDLLGSDGEEQTACCTNNSSSREDDDDDDDGRNNTTQSNTFFFSMDNGMDKHSSRVESSNDDDDDPSSSWANKSKPCNITPDTSRKGIPPSCNNKEPHDHLALETSASGDGPIIATSLSKEYPPPAAAAIEQIHSQSAAAASIIQQSLKLGFSAPFLKNKTSTEVQLLIDSVTLIRNKTRDESGLDASPNLAHVVEQTLGLGFSARFLGGKTEEELGLLLSTASSNAYNSLGMATNTNTKTTEEGSGEEAGEIWISNAAPKVTGVVPDVTPASKDNESSNELLIDEASQYDVPSTVVARNATFNFSQTSALSEDEETLACTNKTSYTTLPINATTTGAEVKSSAMKKSHKAKWERNIEALKQYKKVHGHVDVPSREGKLGRFVAHQRGFYKKRCEWLTLERIQELENLGFKWSMDKPMNKGVANNDGKSDGLINASHEKLALSVEHAALERGFPADNLVNKMEGELQRQLIFSNRMQKIHVEKTFGSKGTNGENQHGLSEGEEENHDKDDDRDIGEELDGAGEEKSSSSSDEQDAEKTSKGTNVTLSDDDDEEGGENSSVGEEENDSDDSDHTSEHNSSSGEDPTSSSSSDEQEECSSNSDEEEESDSDDDDDGKSEMDEETENSEGSEESSEECTSSSDEEEEESGNSENDESDVDKEDDSESEESDEEESDVSSSSGEEESKSSVDDDDESSDNGYVSAEDDDSDVSPDVSIVRRGSWLGSSPLASFNNAPNRGCRTPTSSQKTTSRGTSRFKQWMGRKKASSPKIIQPTKPKRNSLNQERWQLNIVALKAFKDRYGDTNVPSAYGSLGTFVRNTRALYNMPEHPKNWTLTEDRRRMLEEIDFQWALPKLKTTHAYRKRSRNITRAASTLHAINNYSSGTMQQEIAHDERDSQNRKTVISKQIAQHMINTETSKLEGKDYITSQMKVDYLNLAYQEASLAGLTELDLFIAFEEIGQGNEVDVTNGVGNYPQLALGPSQESNSFQEWLSDRKGKWRQQQRRKRKRDWDDPPLEPLEEEVETNEDWGRPKLLSSRLQSEKGFDVWLADRKNEWKEQQQKKWAKKANVGEEKSLLSVQSIEKFQHWLSDRKVIWREQRQRKRRKTQHTTPVVVNAAQIIDEQQLEQKVPIDYRTVGVRLTPSGNWEVGFRYQGLRRSLGTFDTQDQAALANEVGRTMLKTEKGSKLTAKEIGRNVKLARDAALDVVHKSKKQQLKQKAQPLNFRTVGVRQTPSGKWAVEISHKSKLRHIGTFKHQEQAALANKIAREALKTEKGSKPLSAEEVDDKVIVARDAALDAVSRLEIGAHSNQPSPVGAISTLSKTVPTKVKVMASEAEDVLNQTEDIPLIIEHEGKEEELVISGETEMNGSEVAESNTDLTKTKPKVPAGLRQRSSGKWEVVTYYHGKKRHIGTFKHQEQAAVANEIARVQLKVEKGGPKLSDDEIEENVKLTRQAASDAAFRLEDTMHPKVSGSDATRVKSSVASGQHAKPTTATVAAERNQKAPIDFRTVGVRQTPSGKWEVGFRYHGNRRNLGTFDTQDQAALANEVGRRMLKTEKGLKLTAEEVDRNVKLARVASMDAVRKIKRHEDDTPPNVEDMLRIFLMSDEVASKEAGDRPNLLLSRLQPEKIFEAWLADRKNKWKQQQQKKCTIAKGRKNNQPKSRSAPPNSKSRLTSQQSVTAPNNAQVSPSSVSLNPISVLPNRCSYNSDCGAPFHLVPQECSSDNCNGRVHRFCHQCYAPTKGIYVSFGDDVKCYDCFACSIIFKQKQECSK